MSLKIVDSEIWYMMQARLFNEAYAFRHVLSVLYDLVDGRDELKLVMRYREQTVQIAA